MDNLQLWSCADCEFYEKCVKLDPNGCESYQYRDEMELTNERSEN